MKKLCTLILILSYTAVFAQNDPVLSIDGVNTTFKSGLSLPYWLKAGQTLGLVTNVKSVSILEFNADTSNLKFSQVIALTSTQTVPVGKAWKIEGLGLGLTGTGIGGFSNSTIPTNFVSPRIFNNPGNFTWKVPPGVTNICVEVYGGSGGYLSVYNIGNYYGGAGGYGYQCFTVIPGTNYNVQVGVPVSNVGGNSDFGGLINATGGTVATNTGGCLGGTSNAVYNISGGNGGLNTPGVIEGILNPQNYGGFTGSANNGAVLIYW